jgi:hypothetical protein
MPVILLSYLFEKSLDFVLNTRPLAMPIAKGNKGPAFCKCYSEIISLETLDAEKGKPGAFLLICSCLFACCPAAHCISLKSIKYLTGLRAV